MSLGPSLVSPPAQSSASDGSGAVVTLPGRRFRPARLLSPLLFVGPALLLIGVFVIYPSVKTIYYSFYTQSNAIGYNLPLVFTGFDNFANMWNDSAVRTAVINNLLWLIILTPLTVVLGVLLAVLFDRVRYEAVAKSIVFIPMAISATATGVIWRLMYADDPHVGTINAILGQFIPNFQSISWLGNTNLVNFALMGAQLWASLGFAVIVLSAALKAIPGDLLEAARIDGATELQAFRHVTIPLMWPTITVIITLTMIGLLKIFDIVWTMTSGGPAGASEVIGTRMYTEAFKNGNTGYGSAIAVVLLIAVIPIMAINIRRFSSEGQR
ncbi:MAG: ABC-type transporter, integral rane subunit [Chloroflexi bacterium]|jgi:alpha-glucoside transport system permease protein|nr:ABC-type transporter, integral rane subunit [Chloroflexota bacterium]MDB5076867.1 ABC-type transporter, integral rane subunit [Chloroflexota bacterium]